MLWKIKKKKKSGENNHEIIMKIIIIIIMKILRITISVLLAPIECIVIFITVSA